MSYIQKYELNFIEIFVWNCGNLTEMQHKLLTPFKRNTGHRNLLLKKLVLPLTLCYIVYGIL